MRPGASATACIGIGSNLGDRGGHIAGALSSLAALPSTRLVASSSIIETQAAGPIAQGPYLNAAACLETSLLPRELLNHLLEIEIAHGRERIADQRWGPRTLDLDLLLYGEHIIDQPGLTVPHPRLHERPFVLIPLAEIAGDLVIPTLRRTVREIAPPPATRQGVIP
jgi:2-amino-4-hydroxy-6-hydroxymethyldihydropteridine diphosphokinase